MKMSQNGLRAPKHTAEAAGSLSPQSIFTSLQSRLAKCKNEEEVRLAWVSALEKATDIEFDAEQGKRDLSYNNVIIEFKGPGKFNGKKTMTQSIPRLFSPGRLVETLMETTAHFAP